MSNRKYNFARAHNISLPSTKRKLNIDEATSALSSMGYRMGTVRHSLADKTSYWSVTTPTGSVVEVAANKLTDFVYGKIKNLNAQRYTETTYEVLFPDEDEDTQFIDSKEAAIKVARQYAAKGCTVELSQVTKTWRSKSEADAAQIPTNTKETPMRFFKDLNMNKSTYAVVHPSIAGAPLDPYTTKVPILLKDKTTVTAVRNDGRWSIEGRSDMPTSRKFDQLIAELNAAGFTRLGAKAKFGDYYNNPADSSKKVNKLLPRIVAAIKAAGGQVDSVEKHESKSSASIRFPTKGDYQVSIDIGSTYLAVNRYVIRGAGVLQSVHLFNGELSDIDKAVAIAVNEWKKLKAARRHFSRVGAKARFAVRRPSLTLEQVNEINQILNWYQSLKKMEKKDLLAVYIQKMKRGNVEFKPDIREMQKPWMAVDIIRTQFREEKVQAAFDASPSGKPLPLPITHARNGAKAKFETQVSLKEIMDAINRLRADGASEEQIKRFSDMAFRSHASQNRLRDYQKQFPSARTGAKAKFLLHSGITDGIEKGIAKRMKSAARYRAQGNDEMADFTEQDAEDLKRVKRALVQGNGDSNHAKQIAKMIQNLDTEVRRDCGDALIEWAARKAGVTINYARVGAKAKFGEVENLLNMISDQMNSGNNDLAKTNLRKLAAKIGEIRHTRSEWDQFMTVAKSLGFTESQIGGFSRRGSKMTKSTYAISPLQDMANKVQRLNAQYNLLADRAEETKIAARIAYRAYSEAKRILDDAPRPAGVPKYDLPQPERHSRGLSRTGGKANFAAELRQWESYFNQDASVTLMDANQLLKKIKDKKAELKQAEGNIAEGTAMLKTAVATQNTAQYYRANKILDIADGVRSSFSRTGAKAINANVDFKPFHEEMYEYTNGNKPRGRGSWIFVAPDGSLVYAPHGLTYSQAKAWLKKNATINGHYKVAP